jgi:hypothetical protein
MGSAATILSGVLICAGVTRAREAVSAGPTLTLALALAPRHTHVHQVTVVGLEPQRVSAAPAPQ